MVSIFIKRKLTDTILIGSIVIGLPITSMAQMQCASLFAVTQHSKTSPLNFKDKTSLEIADMISDKYLSELRSLGNNSNSAEIVIKIKSAMKNSSAFSKELAELLHGQDKNSDNFKLTQKLVGPVLFQFILGQKITQLRLDFQKVKMILKDPRFEVSGTKQEVIPEYDIKTKQVSVADIARAAAEVKEDSQVKTAKNKYEDLQNELNKFNFEITKTNIHPEVKKNNQQRIDTLNQQVPEALAAYSKLLHDRLIVQFSKLGDATTIYNYYRDNYMSAGAISGGHYIDVPVAVSNQKLKSGSDEGVGVNSVGSAPDAPRLNVYDQIQIRLAKNSNFQNTESPMSQVMLELLNDPSKFYAVFAKEHQLYFSIDKNDAQVKQNVESVIKEMSEEKYYYYSLLVNTVINTMAVKDVKELARLILLNFGGNQFSQTLFSKNDFSITIGVLNYFLNPNR